MEAGEGGVELLPVELVAVADGVVAEVTLALAVDELVAALTAVNVVALSAVDGRGVASNVADDAEELNDVCKEVEGEEDNAVADDDDADDGDDNDDDPTAEAAAVAASADSFCLSYAAFNSGKRIAKSRLFVTLYSKLFRAKARFASSSVSIEPVVGSAVTMKDRTPFIIADADQQGFHDSL